MYALLCEHIFTVFGFCMSKLSSVLSIIIWRKKIEMQYYLYTNVISNEGCLIKTLRKGDTEKVLF